jgi:hypothetical protein
MLLPGYDGSEHWLRGPAMKEPQWHDVLEPREAVFAGIAGLVTVWPLVYYAYHAGYVFWGYSPPQWKGVGTAIDVLGFAIPYVLVRWIVKRRKTDNA